jgi:hypothetical protein
MNVTTLSMTPAAIKQRRWRQNHPERARAASRRHELKRKPFANARLRDYLTRNPQKRKQYHLNDLVGRKSSDTRAYEHWLAQKTTQDNKCAICQHEFTSAMDTHQDHNHKTNQLRGVLCSRCNTGLGQFFESPEILQKAIGYLKVWEQR